MVRSSFIKEDFKATEKKHNLHQYFFYTIKALRVTIYPIMKPIAIINIKLSPIICLPESLKTKQKKLINFKRDNWFKIQIIIQI